MHRLILTTICLCFALPLQAEIQRDKPTGESIVSPDAKLELL